MRTRYKHICQTCGKEFQTTLKDSRFCSLDCRKYKKVCVVCGKEYMAYHEKSKYCSQRCKSKTLPSNYYVKWNLRHMPTGEFTETTDEMIVDYMTGHRKLKPMNKKEVARFIGRDYHKTIDRIKWLEDTGRFEKIKRTIQLRNSDTSLDWNSCQNVNIGYKNTYAIW